MSPVSRLLLSLGCCFLLPVAASAGTVLVDGQTITYDDTWSFKNFAQRPVKNLPNQITVYNSLFYWEQPDSTPFPQELTGVTFVNCNLDNVIVPPDNTIIGGTHRRFKVQADGEDWYLDEKNQPTEPINKERMESEGKNTDPQKIPLAPVEALVP